MKPPVAPLGLTAELCAQVSAALRARGGVMKVAGYAVTANDLDRMAKGGSQDRSDDLARLTANAMTDTQFAAHLRDAVQKLAAGAFAKGAPILIGAAPVPTAQKTLHTIGTQTRPPPAMAAGLKTSQVGAAFKHGADHSHETILTAAVRKGLVEHAQTLTSRPLAAGFFSGAEIARALCKLDAVVVQRVLRDTLRSAPETRALGMDALRLLAPLADALEAAVTAHFFALLSELALTHAQAVAALAGATAPLIDGVLEVSSEPSAAHVPEVFVLATCAEQRLPCGGLLEQIYRRATFTPSGTLAKALVALSDMLATVPIEHRPPPFSQVAGDAKKSAWPKLTTKEVEMLADHIFSDAAEARAALPTGGAIVRSPARMLLVLRGETALLDAWSELLTAALRAESSASPRARSELQAAQLFFSGVDAKASTALVHGLFQIAQGDPEQRARQLGRFVVCEAHQVFVPAATLGPIRVAFVKFWRAHQGPT